jgi:hypothetical protein
LDLLKGFILLQIHAIEQIQKSSFGCRGVFLDRIRLATENRDKCKIGSFKHSYANGMIDGYEEVFVLMDVFENRIG